MLGRQIIALCDSDADYAGKAAGIANRLEGMGNVEVLAFSSPEALSAFQAVERIALMAVNIQWRNIMECKQSDIPTVWLSENPVGDGGASVYKYQSVPQLMQAMLRLSGLPQRLASGIKTNTGQTAKVIAVWSAAGGTGKSTVAALMAEEWHRLANGGVFCLSLDAGMTCGLWLGEEGSHDASDWLYRVRSGKEAELPAENASWSGVQSFRRDVPIREFGMLSKQDAEQLIIRAAAMPGCKRVVIDCGAGWCEASEAAWEMSDVIICIRNEDASSRHKESRWLDEWPGWQKGGAYLRKSVFVTNKALTACPSSQEHEMRSLPYIPEWKQSEERELHRHPAYRQALLHVIGGIEADLAPI